MENNEVMCVDAPCARSKPLIGDRVFVVLPCENFGYGRLCQVVEGTVKLVCLNARGGMWYKVYCEFRAEGFSKLITVAENMVFDNCREAVANAEEFVKETKNEE